jgi:GDPmannose 4,6-dehydratase
MAPTALITGITGQDGSYVVDDPDLYRPAEMDHLLGDATRACLILGWVPRVDIRRLIDMMVDADLARFKARHDRGAPAEVASLVTR